jgi:hypothetical protein
MNWKGSTASYIRTASSICNFRHLINAMWKNHTMAPVMLGCQQEQSCGWMLLSMLT